MVEICDAEILSKQSEVWLALQSQFLGIFRGVVEDYRMVQDTIMNGLIYFKVRDIFAKWDKDSLIGIEEDNN